MSLVDHAKREFIAAGWINKETGEFDDEMQKSICDNVLELLQILGNQGHSGTTAPYAIQLFTIKEQKAWYFSTRMNAFLKRTGPIYYLGNAP